MALTLEVNYFNSFYLKRLAGGDSGTSNDYSTGLQKKQVVPLPPNMYWNQVSPGNKNTGYPWVAPFTKNEEQDWYIEASRIRCGYNNTSVDLGVKAYIVSEEPNQIIRGNSLIYSGVFNSRTGVNNTNQFSVAEEITRSVDPKNGTIQKLFAEDTNLTIFQERKVNVALIDKDAIYSAEGGAITTTANVVIGQITPVPGNWGISTNPESFATYGYSKYFVDKDRNAVLKIEGSSIQEISLAGMTDFFRDQLGSVTERDALLGTYDVYNMNYVLSIQTGGTQDQPARYKTAATYKTLTWDERNKGWTSFFTYKPESYFSCRGNFYSTNDNKLYLHYSNTLRNTFYGTSSTSSVQFVFNPMPNFIKTFKTVNYEGSNGWEITQFVSENTGQDAAITPATGWLSVFDTALEAAGANKYSKIYSYDEGAYVDNGIQYRAGFDRKQNKYYAVIPNNTQTAVPGEVVFGKSLTGIKAYYSTVTIKTDATTDPNGLKSLFAVSTEYINK